jgi:hypothetical protein
VPVSRLTSQPWLRHLFIATAEKDVHRIRDVDNTSWSIMQADASRFIREELLANDAALLTDLLRRVHEERDKHGTVRLSDMLAAYEAAGLQRCLLLLPPRAEYAL